MRAMKTRTILSWLVLVGTLASEGSPATAMDRDRRVALEGMPRATLLQIKHTTNTPIFGSEPRATREQSARSDIQSLYTANSNASYSERQLTLTLYALGAIIYVFFIFVLGWLVGFNDLDKDK